MWLQICVYLAYLAALSAAQRPITIRTVIILVSSFLVACIVTLRRIRLRSQTSLSVQRQTYRMVPIMYNSVATL